MSTALNVQGLNKHFANGKHALRDINLSIQKGEMVALIGASGSGKSTLLRHVAGLVVADGGSPSLIEIDGQCIQRNGALSKNIRQVRSQIGFVFQQFNLVDRLPVLVNVLVGLLHRMPVWRSWLRSFNAAERALAVEALGRVGIADCSNQRASTPRSRAASNSAPPLPAPWCKVPKWCWPTSPLRRWTLSLRARSWRSWPASTATTGARWWCRCTRLTWP